MQETLHGAGRELLMLFLVILEQIQVFQAVQRTFLGYYNGMDTRL